MDDCICSEKEQCTKNIQFINELEDNDNNFHLNPNGFITLGECGVQGVLVTSIDFDCFMFRQYHFCL